MGLMGFRTAVGNFRSALRKTIISAPHREGFPKGAQRQTPPAGDNGMGGRSPQDLILDRVGSP